MLYNSDCSMSDQTVLNYLFIVSVPLHSNLITRFAMIFLRDGV